MSLYPGAPKTGFGNLADRDRRATDFPNVWFPEPTCWGHTLALGEMPYAAWLGLAFLALRSLPEVSLVLRWLMYTPRVLYNLYRPGSRYQSRQANSAKPGYFLTPKQPGSSKHSMPGAGPCGHLSASLIKGREEGFHSLSYLIHPPS